MRTVDTLVIGAGQAGLAVSRCLTERGREHVVLERGRLAERWRSERWDSLRLLSPNWMTRLPGWSYDGSDPGGFMVASDVVALLGRYATASDAPVLEHAAVRSVSARRGRFGVVTDDGEWSALDVVVATGWCDRPTVPTAASALSSSIEQVVPSRYRNPAQLADGGVLVVGASATGVQLAAELRSSGREVVVAVGRHTRLPRRYRGMDVMWWLDRLGSFDRTIDEVVDARAARAEPSLQLTGGRTLDLATLQRMGVRLAGRVVDVRGSIVTTSDDLVARTAAADDRMRRVLDRIDRHVLDHGLGGEVLDPDVPPPWRPIAGPHRLDLRRHGITTVVWATGHHRTYPWLHVPVLDGSGEIVQRRGVTPHPGLYVIGGRFQHHRNSSFIDGVGRDAAFVADHLVARHASSGCALVR